MEVWKFLDKVPNDAVQEFGAAITRGMIVVINSGNKPEMDVGVQSPAGSMFEGFLKDLGELSASALVVGLPFADLSVAEI